MLSERVTSLVSEDECESSVTILLKDVQIATVGHFYQHIYLPCVILDSFNDTEQ